MRSMMLERLYGTYSSAACDPSCQFAVGNECVCSCGGANHRAGFLPTVQTGEITASALQRYREGVARRREQGLARREANRSARRERLLSAMTVAARQVLSLSDDEIAQQYAASRYLGPLRSIASGFRDRCILTENQVRYLEAIVRRTDETPQERTNRYAGVCSLCRGSVGAEQGLLERTDSGFAVRHREGQCLAHSATTQYSASQTPAAADGLYMHNMQVYCVRRSRTSQRRAAYRLVIAGRGSASWSYERGMIFRLTADEQLTEQQARDVGHSWGVCAVCARTLTNPESVELGIGPVCRGRMGWGGNAPLRQAVERATESPQYATASSLPAAPAPAISGYSQPRLDDLGQGEVR